MSSIAPVYRFDAIQRRDDGDTLRCRCRITAELACFDGHFPDLPILPAVAQLDMLQALLLRHTPWRRPIIGGGRLTFSGRIQPGDQLDIELRHQPSGNIEFSISNSSGPASRRWLELARNHHD